VFPDNAFSNPQTAPVQISHLGIWFSSPDDAKTAGCPYADTVYQQSPSRHPSV
jgi:hypothetical protein